MKLLKAGRTQPFNWFLILYPHALLHYLIILTKLSTTGIKPTRSTVSPESISPSPTPQPSNKISQINGNLDRFTIISNKDPSQDGKLNWSITLPMGSDIQQATAFIPGLIIPYAWIAAQENPAQLPDGLDLVGSSSFTGSVVLNFTSGEKVTILHSSPGITLSKLSFSAEHNGSVPENISLEQLLPISLILERTSDGNVRAIGSRNGVLITFILSYVPRGIQFPLLNLTLEASATDTTVDPLDGNTVLTFSTTSRLSEVQIQTLGGTINGRLDDGVELATVRVTASADQLHDGQLNWEIADLSGSEDIGRYRPLLPAIALSAAWLTAQEDPERLMDGREATGNGMFESTVRMQYPQGQTLTLQSTSSGLSPERPQRAVFDVVISGSYPSEEELSVGRSLSLPLQQTAVGVLSGQQSLEQGVIVSLDITYQPLSLQAVPSTLLQVQLSTAEVDSTGLTSTIKFTAVAQLVLASLPTSIPAPTKTPATPAIVPTQSPLPTPIPLAPVDRINGNLNSLSISARRDLTQDGKLDWSVRLQSGMETQQVLTLLPGLTIPYAWIAAEENPAQLPDGLDLVGSSSFTGSVILNFSSGEKATIVHSSPGVILSELSFSAEYSGFFPGGIVLSQLFPTSLIMERTLDGRVWALGFMDNVQVAFTLSYAPNGIQFPLLNLTLEVSDITTSVDAIDGNTVISFSTISRLSEVLTHTLEGSIAGRLDPDLLLPVTRVTVLVASDNGQLSWSISELPDSNAIDLYQALYPAIVLSISWLHADSLSGQLNDGQKVTGNGQFTAVLRVRLASGFILTINTTSHGFTTEEPRVSILEVVISGNYPSTIDLSNMLSFLLVLEQAGNGLLLGQQVLSEDLHIDLTITYIPEPEYENIPRSILSVQLSALEVVAIGSTFSIQFGSRAVLSLFQRPSKTINLLPSTTSLGFVSSSLAIPLPTPTPPDQDVLLCGTVKGTALPTAEIIASFDTQLNNRLEWIVRNFSAPQELELYRTLLPFIPLSATLITGGEQFKIITDETEMNLTIIVELSPGRILRIETSSSIQSGRQIFHQIEFSGSYPAISEVTPFYSISMIMEQDEKGYISGEQVLQGGHRITTMSNYLPSDFNPDETFLLTVMTQSPETLGLSFVMSSTSVFKTTIDMLSSSVSLVSPTSGGILSTRADTVSSVAAVSSPRPPPPLHPVCKFHLFATLILLVLNTV